MTAFVFSDRLVCGRQCCNNSVVAFTSKDTLTWSYSATVGAYDPARVYQEGPNECDVVLLKDKKTLWAVMRVDGGDGTPSHRTLPFLASTSTDGGGSWGKATALPDDMLSAQPKATVLGNGALLLTAGRPGIDLVTSQTISAVACEFCGSISDRLLGVTVGLGRRVRPELAALLPPDHPQRARLSR